MARPLKKGLDYYPLSRADKRFESVRAYHPTCGFEVLAYLLAELHEIEGYYMQWNERAIKRFCLKYAFKQEDVQGVLEDCLIDKIFDEALLAKHGILTSKECQLTWGGAVRERSAIEYNEAYILIDLKDILATIEKNRVRADRKEVNRSAKLGNVNDLETSDILEITPQGNTEGNTTSKAKRSQGKRSKGKESEAKKEILNFSNSESTKVEDSENVEEIQEAPPAPVSEENAPQTVGGGKKYKKEVHPVRTKMISAWQKRFKMAYSQSLQNNSGIKHIIRCIEGNIKFRQPDILEQELHEGILAMWEHILQDWDKTEAYYAKQVSFEKIGKNFENILSQIMNVSSGTVLSKKHSAPNPSSFAGAFNKSNSYSGSPKS